MDAARSGDSRYPYSRNSGVSGFKFSERGRLLGISSIWNPILSRIWNPILSRIGNPISTRSCNSRLNRIRYNLGAINRALHEFLCSSCECN